MLCLRFCSLKPNESIGIKILLSSRTRLGFQPKSFNRKPNSEFEGSWWSTKMHKATIHDPHQQIPTQTPQNWSNKLCMKIQQKQLEKNAKIQQATSGKSTQPWKLPLTRKSGSLQTKEKSNPMEQGNEKQSGWMVCLETLELIYLSPSWDRKNITLLLVLKLWYKPLRGK
jgi:hypothetical protein